MRGRRATLVAAAAISATAIVISIVSVASAGPNVTRIQAVEHASTDTLVDLTTNGDSTGDLLTFHNPIFDATNSHKVGHDQGDCIRISPHAGTWECRWLTYIAGRGAIMVEGAFFDGRNSTMAVTGGTLEFRNARGSMKLVSRHGGAQYDFIFQLLP